MMQYTLPVMFLIAFCHCLPANIKPKKGVYPAEVNFLYEPTDFSPSEAANSVEDVLKDVEIALKANPQLPRLTRGEILDLLENITKTEIIAAKDAKNERKPKAVMKVLPFMPDSDVRNVEDFYTKPPVTKIVGSPAVIEEIQEIPPVKYEQPKLKQQHMSRANMTTIIDNLKKNKPSQRYKHRNNYNSTKSPMRLNNCQGKGSVKCNNNVDISRGKPFSSIQFPTISDKPRIIPTSIRSVIKRKKTTTPDSSTTSSSIKYFNHRYEDELPTKSSRPSNPTLFPSDGIKIVPAPSLPPKVINENLLRIHIEGETQTKPPKIDNVETNVPDEKLPLIVDIPDSLKDIIDGMGIESALKTKAKFPNKAHKNKPEHAEVLDLFSSFENAPKPSTTPIPNIDKVVDNLTPEMKDLLMNFGLIPNENPPVKPLENAEIYYETYNPEVAEIKQDSYTGFKPLPDDDNGRDEMQELLARFGLGRSARKQKSIDNNNSNMDSLEEYEGASWASKISEDSKEQPSNRKSPSKQHVFNPSENLYATKEEIDKLNKLSNVVKHLETLNRPITNEDFKQIDVDTLKSLVNSLNNTIVPLDEQNAPDPLLLEYNLIKNEIKRQENTSSVTSDTTEITPSAADLPTADSSTSDASSSTADASSSTPDASSSIADTSSSAALESKDTATPSIKDLEDSFGGVPDVTTESSPPPKVNGFYYLFDWNSFFDIDDQKGQRVNLRFQPKAGDPKMFYSVTVP